MGRINGNSLRISADGSTWALFSAGTPTRSGFVLADDFSVKSDRAPIIATMTADDHTMWPEDMLPVKGDNRFLENNELTFSNNGGTLDQAVGATGTLSDGTGDPDWCALCDLTGRTIGSDGP